MKEEMLMCRYLKAEQFIGATFSRLIEENIYEIEISTLCKIEREVDIKIREINNAMLCISMNEMYSVIEDYNDFFQVKRNSIVIKESLQKRLQEEEREDIIDQFYSYFLEGMPRDINDTVRCTLKTAI